MIARCCASSCGTVQFVFYTKWEVLFMATVQLCCLHSFRFFAFFKKCLSFFLCLSNEQDVRLLMLVGFCSQGDNIPDAVAMATRVQALIHVCVWVRNGFQNGRLLSVLELHVDGFFFHIGVFSSVPLLSLMSVWMIQMVLHSFMLLYHS